MYHYHGLFGDPAPSGVGRIRATLDRSWLCSVGLQRMPRQPPNRLSRRSNLRPSSRLLVLRAPRGAHSSPLQDGLTRPSHPATHHRTLRTAHHHSGTPIFSPVTRCSFRRIWSGSSSPSPITSCFRTTLQLLRRGTGTHPLCRCIFHPCLSSPTSSRTLLLTR